MPWPRRTRRPAALLAAVCAALLAGALTACTGPDGGADGGADGGPGQAAQQDTSTGLTGGAVRPFQPAHAGDTLTVLATSGAGSLDPQVAVGRRSGQLFRAVYDGLVGFQQVHGDASFTLTPDLATALPAPSADGRTYLFTLRRGVRFSTGREVTTDDVVASFRRLFRVSAGTAGTFYGGIVGADACLRAPTGCTLDGGLVADRAAGTVTFHLTAPDPEFLYKLAVTTAVVLPAQTPPTDRGTSPIPGTGAYTIESYQPAGALVLVRNPAFREWNRAAQPAGYPDRIVQRYGTGVSAAATEVIADRADAVGDELPGDTIAELLGHHPGQVHVNPAGALLYLPINVNLPPFDNLKARQAVNWAIDRSAVARLLGGPAVAVPACTILPPSFPGHVDDCRYTWPAGTTWRGPAQDEARRLVQQSGTAGARVQVVVGDDEVSVAVGRYVADTLTAIGWQAEARPVRAALLPGLVQNTDNHVQISLARWSQDSPGASDSLAVLFGCPSFVPGSDSSPNASGYCDPQVQVTMDHAARAAVSDQIAADKLWGQADKAVMAAAAAAPLVTPKQVDLVSTRVGDYQWSRLTGMILSQLWVR
jgi:peptide/nickel transport system substrate-binding protein